MRLTLEDKSLLSHASNILGVSDFFRNSALEKVSGFASLLAEMFGKV